MLDVSPQVSSPPPSFHFSLAPPSPLLSPSLSLLTPLSLLPLSLSPFLPPSLPPSLPPLLPPPFYLSPPHSPSSTLHHIHITAFCNCLNQVFFSSFPQLLLKCTRRVQLQRKHVSASVRKYRHTYYRQLQLNKNFQLFVKSYEETYMGPNTAEHQIGSPVPELCMSLVPVTIILHISCYLLCICAGYSDKGEELPLGPNFQTLVAYFMRYGC